MKKVISILIAFTLVFAFVGCGPTDEEVEGGDPDICDICGGDKASKPKGCICNAYNKDEKLSPDAVKALEDIGLKEADVLAPKGAKFGNYMNSSATPYFACYWTGANQAMFNAYKTEYLAKPDREAVGDKTPWTTANIMFYDKVLDKDDSNNGFGVELPAGTITFVTAAVLKTAK